MSALAATRLEAKSVLDRLFARAPIGIALLRPNGLVIDWNAHAGELLGISKSEAPQTNFFKLFEPDTNTDSKRLLNTDGVAARPPSFSRKGQHGIQHFEVLWTSLSDLSPGALLVFFQDVTERKRVEDALHFRSEMEKTIISISTQLLQLPSKDIDRGISESMGELGLGLKVDKVVLFRIGSDCADQTHEWCADGINSDLEKLRGLKLEHYPHAIQLFLKGEVFWADSIHQVHPDAKAERMLMEAIGAQSSLVSPLHYQGELVGFLGLHCIRQPTKWCPEFVNILKIVGEIFLSAIQRASVERVMMKQMENLVRSNADLEQFAYISSHDLKEPLRTIGLYIELLSRKLPLDNDTQPYMDTVIEASRRMQNLIQDILQYASSAKEELKIEQVNTKEVIDLALSNLQRAVLEHNACIRVDDLPALRADRFQLMQLFQNLISNAIKYHDTKPPEIKITAEIKDNECVFKIKDNGVGIDSRYQNKIFKIFQRLQRSTEEGTGIGLAISKKIVERHGGRIWLDSKPGEGSTFFFSLPL